MTDSTEQFLEARRNPVLRLVFRAQRAISFSLLALIIVLVALQVFTRYVLNQPFTWTEEIARFAMVWFTFMSASYVTAERRHIRVIFFERFLSPTLTRLITWFAQLMVGLTASVMLYSSYLAASASQIGGTASGIPISVVYLSALVGYALIVLHTLIEVADWIRGGTLIDVDQAYEKELGQL